MTTSQHLLYIGSYATAEKPGIYAFTFDATNGSLTANWSFTGIVNPSFLVPHPNKRWLYAVSETSQQQEGKAGEVWALALQSQTTPPQVINHQASGGDWPCHLAIDHTGHWLITSNYATGSVAVFPILTDGRLGERTDFIQHHGHGPNAARQEGPHAHSATFSPDNHFVIVADLGTDQLVIYNFDPLNGRLVEHSQIGSQPGSGPRHLVFHPNGNFLYVAYELSNTVTLYDYEAAAGVLKERQTSETLPPDAPENTVADIHLTPNGKWLYVSNRGHDSIAVFAIAAHGQLERVDISPCGGRCPRNFAIAPDGRFLVVANQQSDEIAVLPILTASHGPGAASTSIALPGASCVQFAESNYKVLMSE